MKEKIKHFILDLQLLGEDYPFDSDVYEKTKSIRVELEELLTLLR